MNKLKKDLTNVVVVLSEGAATGTNEAIVTRIFRCVRGRGCDPHSKGATIVGRFLDNKFWKRQEITIDADDIEREATPREVELAVELAQ